MNKWIALTITIICGTASIVMLAMDNGGGIVPLAISSFILGGILMRMIKGWDS